MKLWRVRRRSERGGWGGGGGGGECEVVEGEKEE